MVKKALFQLGQIVATPGALDAFEAAQQLPDTFLKRHVQGDWGNVCEEDSRENDFSVTRHLRLMSVYTLTTNVVVWLITEADRSATTFLLPSEY